MKEVWRGHDMMETTAMPMIIADLTLYMISNAVTMPPQKMPIQTLKTFLAGPFREKGGDTYGWTFNLMA